MSSAILSNLKHVERLEGRSNYQVWKTSMEVIFELEGLWNIVSGLRLRPTPAARIASASANPRHPGSSESTGSSDKEEINQWTADARRASIILELSLANEQMFLLQEISRDDPHARWIHIKRCLFPDTALETARLYCQLLDIKPQEMIVPASSSTVSPKRGRRSLKRRQNKKRPKCSNCKKMGHTEEKCWFKHLPQPLIREAITTLAAVRQR